MKKSSSMIIGIVVVIIVAVGAYAIFHKSSNTASNTSTTTSQASGTKNAVVITKTDSKLGQYLSEPSGRGPLYTYNADTAGVSNCTGSCLATWPAYIDTSSTTNLPAGIGTIKRSDNGQKQYTYNGLPLYTFIGDTSGHPTGNGVDNFKLATPAASSSSSSSNSSSSSSSNYPY